MSASSASLRPSPLLLLLALLVAMCSHMAVSQTCTPGCEGLAGRDGRYGPPGLSATISQKDYITIKNSVRENVKYDILGELEQNAAANADNKTANCSAGIGESEENPASSCQAIFLCDEESPSGFYYITVEENNATDIKSIYCNMEDTKCGVRGGWMRVAHINMTSENATCPFPLRMIDSPRPLCGKNATHSPGCTSVTFSTGSLPYTRVCGRSIGYAFYSPDAFHSRNRGIDGEYVDGLSITHGQPRKHIWTYAAGLSEDANYPGHNCPCAVIPGPSAPAFVGRHFHCESGNKGAYETQLYEDDPLWDGEDCDGRNNCCSTSGLPWFCRKLPCETTDDIEVRWCNDEVIANEEVLTELLEIYVL